MRFCLFRKLLFLSFLSSITPRYLIENLSTIFTPPSLIFFPPSSMAVSSAAHISTQLIACTLYSTHCWPVVWWYNLLILVRTNLHHNSDRVQPKQEPCNHSHYDSTISPSVFSTNLSMAPCRSHERSDASNNFCSRMFYRIEGFVDIQNSVGLVLFTPFTAFLVASILCGNRIELADP